MEKGRTSAEIYYLFSREVIHVLDGPPELFLFKRIRNIQTWNKPHNSFKIEDQMNAAFYCIKKDLISWIMVLLDSCLLR